MQARLCENVKNNVNENNSNINNKDKEKEKFNNDM